jgi:hypothetical protein
MASVILELLEIVGSGTYTRGKLVLPDWAREVRERVRRRLMLAWRALTPIMLHCNSTEGVSSSW